MIKRLERFKNTVNKYMTDIRPDRLTICQSERKSVVSRRPSVFPNKRSSIITGTALGTISVFL
jgi:hypothetical protein